MSSQKPWKRFLLSMTCWLIAVLWAPGQDEPQADTPKLGEGLQPKSPAESSRLRQALGDADVGKHWIYDDLATAIARARESGKPLLVVFR
jgi:hypothetical protein